MVENPSAKAEDVGLIPGLEREMAAHSSILAWKIPWTEEPGSLQSTGLPKSWAQLSDSTTMIINNTEYLFICLLAMCMSSLEKCLFSSLAHFLIRSFFFWN